MALSSPGVQVTVVDESFYTPAEPGTTPLIIVATAQDKPNASGTGTATATTKANAGKAYKVTSQRDLVDLFGVPTFSRTASGSPVHGGEQNEYGLQAAYSLMGVTNSAWIVRADVNLTDIAAKAAAPGSNPLDGQWWLDTTNSTYGIFEWNGGAKIDGGQSFANKKPVVLTVDDVDKLENTMNFGWAPKSSVGSVGDYAIVTYTSMIRVFFNKRILNALTGEVVSNEWVLVGSNEWKSAWPTITGTSNATVANTGQFSINGTLITNPGTTIGSLVAKINQLAPPSVTAVNSNGRLQLFTDGSTGNTITLVAGTPGEGVTNLLATIGMTAGVYRGPELQMSAHTSVPPFKTASDNRPTGSVWVKTTEPNLGARWRVKRWNGTTLAWVEQTAPILENPQSAIYSLDKAGGGRSIPTNTVFAQYNAEEDTGNDETPQTATFKLYKRVNAGAATVITSGVIGTNTITAIPQGATAIVRESIKGQTALSSVTVTFGEFNGNAADAEVIATAFGISGLVNVTADVVGGKVVISHTLGGEIRLTDTSGILSDIGFVGFNGSNAATATTNLYAAPVNSADDFIASNWKPLGSDYVAAANAPLEEALDGQLWYSSMIEEVDIMVHNGTTWRGYQNQYSQTDPAGPQVAASRPTTQSTGAPLVDGDLWISTADLENYPTIYRFSGDLQKYVLVDKSDQTTEEGILFADARWDTNGQSVAAATIVELLESNFLDADAPDPALYPAGMLLWNLRRSGFNVKRFVRGHVDTTADNIRFNNVSQANYIADRWVTESGTNEDGSGTFGRQAQRKAVVKALKSTVDTTSDIRETELRVFNLIACPGYPELMSNLVNLNIDRKLTSFVVGDTPLRLKADATTLTNWGGNAAGALDNNDQGIVTYDEYCAAFYPNGFTTDNFGNNIVVPASHMMLRTITLSDQVSYPWFAPAGTRRGGITNATAVGYIDALSGEFQQVSLNEGQRDTLYDIKVNPITFFNGVGLVNYGQKTRAKNASALDRINVARLVVYLRSQLNKLAKPYVFEPNDKITRDEIKQAAESLLLELVGLRAIYDFAVVCDESNNTPSRIDRNELYLDIAIEPVKAIEFIYIPLRLLNTGELQG
jgi:hypothetical protein